MDYEGDKPKPLPNLKYKIEVGDSLITPNPTEIKLTDVLIEKYRQVKAEYTKTHNGDRKKVLEKEITKLKKEISLMTPGNHSVDQFDWSLDFAEVFADNGFDILVTNPPYIKEDVSKAAFDGLRNSPYYQGKMDLWYFFGCKGLDLLKEKTGILSFIATNNWHTNDGASKWRNKIVSDAEIKTWIDFGNVKVFQEADVQTMILLCQKNNSNTNYTFDLRRLKGKDVNLSDAIDLLAKEPSNKAEYINPYFLRKNLKDKYITFSDSSEEKVLNKIVDSSNFSLFSSEISSGIDVLQDFVNRRSQKIIGDNFKVGDGVFVLSQDEKDKINFSPQELELIKPYYTTKELSKYYGESNNKYWIIYTDSSFRDLEKIKPYPKIKKHLDLFQEIITSVNKPYGLHRSRKEKIFKGEKIFSVRKCLTPLFTYTDFDCYVSRPFNIIKTDRINLKYLTGFLNSKITYFWLLHKGKLQGHQFQVDKKPLLETPIIFLDWSEQEKVINLVDIIIGNKLKDKNFNTEEIELKINHIFYQSFNFTLEEIKIIESSSTLTNNYIAA